MTANKHSIYRQGFALLFGILIFLLCVFTLEKTGVPRGYSIALTAAAVIAVWAVVALSGGATSATKYFFTARETRSTVNALAMTSILAFPVLIGSGGGLLFVNPALFIVLVTGSTIGVAFSAIIVSRPFHETGASDLGDLLIRRYQSTLLARCAGLALLASGIGLASIGIYYAAKLTSWFFLLDHVPALVAVLITTLLAALLGGSHSATRISAVAAAILMVGINLPLILQSVSQNGFPIGQITFGNSALVDMWDLEDQLRSLGITLLENTVLGSSALTSWTGGELVAAGLVVATAVAFYPALSNQYAVSQSPQMASRSANKLVLFIAFVGLSLISLLIFSKYGLYQTTLGLLVSEARIAAPFLYNWGERSFDLVTLCGQVLAAQEELLSACSDGADHVVGIQDLQLDGELLLAAAPDIYGLPFAFTALLTCGIILTLISFTAMTLLATANIITSAFFSNVTAHVASAKIFISRAFVLLFGISAAGAVLVINFDTLAVFMFSMSVIACICTPVLVGSLWLKQSGSAAVLSATAIGFGVMILYFVQAKYGVDFAPATGDELQIILPGMASIIPPELAAVYGVPVSLLVLYGSAFYADIFKPSSSPAK